MIDSTALASRFAALAHHLRVDVLKCLLAHYPAELSFGHIAKKTGIAPSTLAHHLSAMEEGGVIARTVRGRSTLVRLRVDQLRAVAMGLMDECCSVDDTDPASKFEEQ